MRNRGFYCAYLSGPGGRFQRIALWFVKKGDVCIARINSAGMGHPFRNMIDLAGRESGVVTGNIQVDSAGQDKSHLGAMAVLGKFSLLIKLHKKDLVSIALG